MSHFRLIFTRIFVLSPQKNCLKNASEIVFFNVILIRSNTAKMLSVRITLVAKCVETA